VGKGNYQQWPCWDNPRPEDLSLHHSSPSRWVRCWPSCGVPPWPGAGPLKKKRKRKDCASSDRYLS